MRICIDLISSHLLNQQLLNVSAQVAWFILFVQFNGVLWGGSLELWLISVLLEWLGIVLSTIVELVVYVIMNAWSMSIWKEVNGYGCVVCHLLWLVCWNVRLVLVCASLAALFAAGLFQNRLLRFFHNLFLSVVALCGFLPMSRCSVSWVAFEEGNYWGRVTNKATRLIGLMLKGSNNLLAVWSSEILLLI